jgi:CHAT domain-containing protein
VNSLARSFLAAGSRSVVGSLWDVDDGGTAALMAHFYRLLAAGAGGAEALAGAQRAMIGGSIVAGSEVSSHPWFWAGFVLIGDPR